MESRSLGRLVDIVGENFWRYPEDGLRKGFEDEEESEDKSDIDPKSLSEKCDKCKWKSICMDDWNRSH